MSIIGDKSSFAIEFDIEAISPYVMGYIRMWIRNNHIGDITDKVMLDCSLGSFYVLVSDDHQKNLLSLNFPDLSNKDLLYFIQNDIDEDKHDLMLFNIDESTDNFLIYVFRKGESINFLWKSYDNEEEILLSSCSFNYFKQIVLALDDFVQNLKKINA